MVVRLNGVSGSLVWRHPHPLREQDIAAREAALATLEAAADRCAWGELAPLNVETLRAMIQKLLKGTAKIKALDPKKDKKFIAEILDAEKAVFVQPPERGRVSCMALSDQGEVILGSDRGALMKLSADGQRVCWLFHPATGAFPDHP